MGLPLTLSLALGGGWASGLTHGENAWVPPRNSMLEKVTNANGQRLDRIFIRLYKIQTRTHIFRPPVTMIVCPLT